MDSVAAADRLDQLFAVLCDPVRRQVLSHLYERGGTDATSVSVADLTTDASDYHEVVLHHVHLPKLTEAGYVDWDDTDRVVSPGDRFDEVEALLDLLDEHRGEHQFEWP